MGLDVKRPLGCRRIKLFLPHPHVCARVPILLSLNDCVLRDILPELDSTSEHRAGFSRGFGNIRPNG